jgi:hypothetical protein
MFLLVFGGAALAAVLAFGFREPSARPDASVRAGAETASAVPAAAVAPGAVAEPAVAEPTPVAGRDAEVPADETPSATRPAAGTRSASAPPKQTADAPETPKPKTPEAPSTPPAESPKSPAAPADPLSNTHTAHLTPRDVTITTFPDGANVMFNGRSLGKAPTVARQILPGQYDVVVSKEGYRTATYLFTVHNFLTEKRFDLQQELVIPKDLRR